MRQVPKNVENGNRVDDGEGEGQKSEGCRRGEAPCQGHPSLPVDLVLVVLRFRLGPVILIRVGKRVVIPSPFSESRARNSVQHRDDLRGGGAGGEDECLLDNDLAAKRNGQKNTEECD